MSQTPQVERYASLHELFRKNRVVWMAEKLIRPRFPHELPCDVLWFFDKHVVRIVSIDLEEGSSQVVTQSWKFTPPEVWEEFSVGVI